jgi:hypothetical protein
MELTVIFRGHLSGSNDVVDQLLGYGLDHGAQSLHPCAV